MHIGNSSRYSINPSIGWILFVVVILIWSWYVYQVQKEKYIHPFMSQQPIQLLKTNSEISSINLGDNVFDIQVIGHISLWGIITSISDKDHIEKFNTISLCLLWGDNLSLFKKGEYSCWHEKGQCMLKVTSDNKKKFTIKNFSNNHLLLPSIQLQNQAKILAVGDQISIVGLLVNIKRQSSNSWLKTSIIREDFGDGACEIILPEHMEILQRTKLGDSAIIHIVFILVSIVILYINLLFRKNKY